MIVISKEELLERFVEHSYKVTYDGTSTEYGMTLTGIRQVIDELDADREKSIVHCGECTFRSHEEGEWHSCLIHGGIKLHEKHFCSDGEIYEG